MDVDPPCEEEISRAFQPATTYLQSYQGLWVLWEVVGYHIWTQLWGFGKLNQASIFVPPAPYVWEDSWSSCLIQSGWEWTMLCMQDMVPALAFPTLDSLSCNGRNEDILIMTEKEIFPTRKARTHIWLNLIEKKKKEEGKNIILLVFLFQGIIFTNKKILLVYLIREKEIEFFHLLVHFPNSCRVGRVRPKPGDNKFICTSHVSILAKCFNYFSTAFSVSLVSKVHRLFRKLLTMILTPLVL